MSLLIASVFPVIIFLYVIFQKDHEKEPFSLLMKCFLGGILSAVISLCMSIPLGYLSPFFPGPILSSFHSSFLEAAIPEEIAKFIVLYWFIWNHKEFNHYYDGIVYAVFVSLGFALLENILYVYRGGMTVAMFRAVLSVPGHGFFAVSMGYFFSLARFKDVNERSRYLALALLVPILFHGGYDFLLSYASTGLNNILVLLSLLVAFGYLVIKLWRVGIRKINDHLATDRQKISP